MTSPFQWIADNAQDIQINQRGVVAQTTARDQTVRATSRGGIIWRLTITPSIGAKWSTSRGYVQNLNTADKFTTDTINFSRASVAYLFGYLGNASNPNSLSITATQGSKTVNVTGATISSGFLFKSGDLLQGSGLKRVYSVESDVPFSSSSVTLNRPWLEASGTYTAVVGSNVNWYVICTSMPDYKIVPGDRVEWNGTFSFVESLA